MTRPLYDNFSCRIEMRNKTLENESIGVKAIPDGTLDSLSSVVFDMLKGADAYIVVGSCRPRKSRIL